MIMYTKPCYQAFVKSAKLHLYITCKSISILIFKLYRSLLFFTLQIKFSMLAETTTENTKTEFDYRIQLYPYSFIDTTIFVCIQQPIYLHTTYETYPFWRSQKRKT